MSTASIFTPPIAPSVNQDITWQNLHGSAPALALAQVIAQQQQMLLVVTADTPQALRLEQEIKSFLAHQPHLRDNVMVFPDWETLPYDNFSPHQDITSERLTVLSRLPETHRGALIVSLNTLLHRLSPVDYVAGQTLQLATGQRLDGIALRQRLERAGYRAVEQVMEHGEFCARGAILDLFPMGSRTPLRIDFFDDEIDSIRRFDPETQRSEETIDSVNLLPAREFATDKTAIERFRANYRERFDANNAAESIYQQVSKGLFPAGIEYYLPLFFEHTATLFDYLPNDALLVSFGNIQGSLERLWHDINYRYEQRRYDIQRPLLTPNELFLAADQVHAGFKRLQRIRAMVPEQQAQPGSISFNTQAIDDIAADTRSKEPLKALRQFIESSLAKRQRILFYAETAGRRETLRELLSRIHISAPEFEHFSAFYNADASIGLTIGAVVNSFFSGNDEQGQGIWVVTETELLGQKVAQRRRREQKASVSADTLIRNLAELQQGQPVVHIDHGVGRYQGLTTLDAGGITTEFVTIEYAGGSTLYVPVSSLHVLSRYSGGEQSSAPLHKLGNDSWEKAKRRAAEKIRDVAAELLDIYARRAVKQGHAFAVDANEYQRFADSFPFEETADQQQAIQATLADMQAPRAMDRLVCGDVGFGKTEVAMRAAFVAVNDGKQVAVLVPTTLLAQQHYENFKDRFADWPVKVEVLSRFRTAKQTQQILAQLADGKIDILIGTHKLLQKDIVSHDLGLLIVDEEHRFGVRQKDAIKKLRANVDILTLTATPIPRTLNMAMNNIRDLSIIATPPAKRLAVKTFVREYDNALIREAILREILRGGQAYFLHNNVDTIDKTARDIAELVPEARVTVAHGQMRERELERIMSDFYHQRFNVLVCTTIVETGIDIPSANTIIMDRADHLGLAQMHQLRGRVGRSHHQAYAYLLTPHPKRLSKDASKRLEAISQLEDLGAGFMLATHDLEIRGAGELLGDDQSGQIESIGFTLYMDMLDDAVAALREGREPSLNGALSHKAEVDLRIAALLPDDYIADVNIRLSLYKRIASCEDDAQLDELQVEMIDRFGLLPQAAKQLIEVTRIRNQAQALGIRKIDMGRQGGAIEFADKTSIEPQHIIALIQQAPNRYKLDGPNRLRLSMAVEDTQARLKLIQSLLAEFDANRQGNAD
ncbi:transcription-repair coupling factor [Idiomarina xiamenensis]|uniref:Transcription-repair-coupling factor n=1 Tax=Idiomarina xiamenensis 10-D-4 TaxID=740709 RepID=K2JHU8_9GAMM|nr:transcription-repair coupling factor [Idiomarina xiamenensis]EKE82956.1 transcription-repair coupling factor [Idiomarina xiamenensis 10-D-4]